MRITLLLLLAAPWLSAQAPRVMFPWWEMPVSRDLNLNEDQQRQIRSVLRETRAQLIDLRAAVEKSEGEVEDLFNDDTVDQKRTAEAIDRLLRARNELSKAFSQLSLRLRAMSTPQQWRDLQRRRGPEPNPAGRPPGAPQGQPQPRPPR